VVDLDFCEYIDTLIEKYRLLDVLDKFARGDLLKGDGACLIITACTRPGRIKKRFDYDVFRVTIPTVFERMDTSLERCLRRPIRIGMVHLCAHRSITSERISMMIWAIQSKRST